MASKRKKAAFTPPSIAPDPEWKRELLAFLDTQTVVPLVEQLRNGVITEDVLLFLNLGIATERLQAVALRFNRIIKRFSSKSHLQLLSDDDLAGCERLSDLIKLVGSRL